MDQRTISRRVYARIGLCGNPSDQFYGQTIALSLHNYYAEVSLEITNDSKIEVVPNWQCDQLRHDSFASLVERIQTEGCYGGIRLILSACVQFAEYCKTNNIDIDSSKGFKISYQSNIPRQVGLSGSSAIVCATINCLIDFYEVQDRIPVAERPTLVLSVEQRLGINAGLQDRVIQVYGGLVHMDFEESKMKLLSRGTYTYLDESLLPPLYLLYSKHHNASDSGKIHSDVRQRWLAGDKEIVHDMKQVAGLATEALVWLERGNMREFGRVLDQNFNLRRKMYGDEVLGARNVGMVELARRVAAHANFTGSGGAVCVLCNEGQEQVAELQELCYQSDLVCERVQVAPRNFLYMEGYDAVANCNGS
eukprot:TRINITY_DN9449_c0_g1_i1.p1 TRINITY_DN9449_c0_g1~~TRINITY_DN9449_c0_g1_i1.p1  ORF type:complete len:364 (-),score=35.55 TRINITY_DN9449_c0_g1_i1:227-1318(-)